MPGKHKRVPSASDTISTTATKKARAQKASPTKSKYFSEPGDEPEQTEEDSPSDTNGDASDFEEDGPADSEVSEVDEDDASDSDHTPASKGRSVSSKSTPKASEIWKPGVKTGERLMIDYFKRHNIDWADLIFAARIGSRKAGYHQKAKGTTGWINTIRR